MSEVWAKWEGHVIDAAFPLRVYLGGSDHSGVFITGHATENLADAALKLVPAIPTLAESQLAHWNAAASLTHPHLIRLFATGRCQLGTLQCLYAVMEYAEQNLAQLLLHRALTDAEVRDMLPPALDALAFLHSMDRVHGQLKPSNVLVVGDRLKLASDTIRPAGEPTTSISMSSVYDPPEARDGSFSTAGDIWALGVTLFQALTRKAPAKPDERSHGVVLPPDFPPAFADVVRQCLSRRPADRPSVSDLQAWVNRGLQGPVVMAPIGKKPERALSGRPRPLAQAKAAPAADRAVSRVARAPAMEREAAAQKPRRRAFAPLLLGAAAILLVCWVAVRMFVSRHDHAALPTDTPKAAVLRGDAPPASAQSPSGPAPIPPQASAPAPDTKHVTPRGVRSPSVVHEEIPAVPRSALATIRGHVRVAVRVTVDGSGTVVSHTLVDPGPSRYFARVAMRAARKWKFARTSDRVPRRWLVRFEFSRSGTTAHAVATS
jgi:TonB family protein